ncbi:MAG: hypothetical protein R1F54_05970 [Candidatus Zeuxoniibacter abyssi]|nr:MAG: hypothetical protein R1F54_05970 [Candidatus Persebacteraceae bacterium AB1(2)]
MASIVEGHGDRNALPTLIKKLKPNTILYEPTRIPRDKFLNDNEFRGRHLQIMRSFVEYKDNKAVIILFDAEEECCKELLNKIQATVLADIDKILSGINYIFALAEKGYESWLVAGFGGPDTGKGNPQKWLKDNIPSLNGRYRKAVGQKRMSAQLDIERAKNNSPSFHRFAEKITALPLSIHP